MFDGLEVCSRLHVKFTGVEDLASGSGDEFTVSLVAAIDGISCERCMPAVGRTSFVKDFCDFVEIFDAGDKFRGFPARALMLALF